MKPLAALLIACLTAGAALAQERQRPPHKAQMKQEERQRMREDMRDAYRGGARPERQRPMSPHERDRLRRDVQDANREMRR
jgi:hypothetical protein